MNNSELWLIILVGFCCLLGFAVSVILYISNRNQALSPRILAAILFSLSYALLGYLLYISHEILRFPHLFRTPVFLSLCIAPLAFIYVRSVLQQAFRLKRTDWWFFVPAVLYTLQFIPFYLLPASSKRVIIAQAIENKALGAREVEALLPAGIGFIIRVLYSLGLTLGIFRMLFRWKRSAMAADMLQQRQNQEIYQWLSFLATSLLLLFVAMIFGYMAQVNHWMDQYRVAALFLAFTVFCICAYLLVRPNILYGLHGWQLPVVNPIQHMEPGPAPNKDLHEGSSADRRTVISPEQRQEYMMAIEQYFGEHRPFTKPRYTVREMAADTGIPSYLLSAFINQEYGVNFNEYINQHRIQYLTQMVKDDPGCLNQYTLEVLGQMAGFNSRATLIAASKRHTGQTPSALFARAIEEISS